MGLYSVTFYQKIYQEMEVEVEAESEDAAIVAAEKACEYSDDWVTTHVDADPCDVFCLEEDEEQEESPDEQ